MTTYKCDYCQMTCSREIFTVCDQSPNGAHEWNELPECPQCDGDGMIWCEPSWDEDYPSTDEGHYIPCTYCNGTSIDPGPVDRIIEEL